MSSSDSSPDSSADSSPAEMDVGLQPIDAFLTSHSFSNHDIVAAAAGSGLTHKVVAKARKGRALTARAQKKLLAAVSTHCRSQGVTVPGMPDLFNYRGRS